MSAPYAKMIFVMESIFKKPYPVILCVWFAAFAYFFIRCALNASALSRLNEAVGDTARAMEDDAQAIKASYEAIGTGRAMQEWVSDLSKAATFVVAIGDCATWGGIPATAPNPSNSRGLQFLKRAKGGYLGDGFVSKSGLPVINVPGCPAHPDWITQIVVAVATGRAADIGLDEFQRPKALEIIDVEGRGLCSGCGAEPVMTMPLGRCPVCHEPSLRIVAGTELKIKEMEVESCV